MPDPKQNIKKLYEAVSKEYDLPDFETFSSDMQDIEKRNKLYTAVSKEYDLPDFDTFSSDIGTPVKKKGATRPTLESTPSRGSLASPGKSEVPINKKQQEQFLSQSNTLGDSLKGIESTVPKIADSTVVKDIQSKNLTIPDAQKQQQKERIEQEKGFMQSLIDTPIEALTSGVLNMVGGVSGLIGGVADVLIDKNPDAKYPIFSDKWIGRKIQQGGELENPSFGTNQWFRDTFMGASSTLSKVAGLESQDARKSIGVSDTSKSTIDHLLSGNIKDTGKSLVVDVIEQLPNIVLMASTGGSSGSLGVVGASSAGANLQEQYSQDQDISMTDLSQGIVMGITEVVTEKVFDLDVKGLSKIGGKLSDFLGSSGKDLKEKIAREGVEKVRNEIVRSTSDVLKQGAKGVKEEVLEENIVTVVDYFVKAIDEDVFNQEGFSQLLKDMGQSTLVAAASGGGISTIAAKASQVKFTKQESRKIEQYKEILANENISLGTKNIAKNRIEEINAGVETATSERYDKIVALPIEDRIDILDKQAKIQTLEADKVATMDVEINSAIDERITELNAEIDAKINPKVEPTAEEGVKEAGSVGVGGDVKLEKPSAEQQLKDINEGNVVTFEYKNESEVPDVFKDNISSKGEINGKPYVKVTMSKSLADFHLQEQSLKEQSQPAQEVAKQEESNIPDIDIDAYKEAEQQLNIEDALYEDLSYDEEYARRERELQEAKSGDIFGDVFEFLNEKLGRIRPADYDNLGDPNWRKDNNAFNILYASNSALPLDSKLQDLSEEFGREITGQDVIDYIQERTANPKKYNKAERKKALKEASEIPPTAQEALEVYRNLRNDKASMDAVDQLRGSVLSDNQADLIQFYLKSSNEQQTKFSNERASRDQKQGNANIEEGEGVSGTEGTSTNEAEVEAQQPTTSNQGGSNKPPTPPVVPPANNTQGGLTPEEADAKVVNMMAKGEKQIRDGGKKDWWNTIKRYVLNRRTDLDKQLNKSEAGQRARKFNENVSGSISHADDQYQASVQRIYAKHVARVNKKFGKLGININQTISELSGKEEADVNAIIFLNRVINIDQNTAKKNKKTQTEIDTLTSDRLAEPNKDKKKKITKKIQAKRKQLKEDVKHPDGFNESEAKIALEGMKNRIGDKAFTDLEGRANAYSEIRREMLREMHQEGLISDDTLDNLLGDSYVERKFLDHIFDDSNFSAGDSSLSSNMIKALMKGSEGLLITDARLLLHSAYRAQANRIATNKANTELANAVRDGGMDKSFAREAKFKKNLNGDIQKR
jgi:hypothetical protein